MAKKDETDTLSDRKTEPKTDQKSKLPKSSCRNRSKEPSKSKEPAIRIEKSRMTVPANRSTGRMMRSTAQPSAVSPEQLQKSTMQASLHQSPSLADFAKDAKDYLPTYGESWMQNRPNIVQKEFQPIEEHIHKLYNYHGFVCREDIAQILTKPGEWLVRTSLHPSEAKKKGKTVRETSKEKCRKEKCVGKSIVFSVFGTEKEKDKDKKSTPIRNLILKFIDGKVALSAEPPKQFKNVAELILHYQKNPGTYKDADFLFLKPVPLCSWEFQHDDIELLEKKLGEGAFGDVRVGKLKTKDQRKVDVAVKMLKNATTEQITRDQVIELLHEARMMRILDHPNVLKTYGIAVLQEPQYLMSELCSLGALREYLKEHEKTISMAEKLGFVLGAARGVEYLHSQKMIHRDLAVRNVLLTEDKTPKISDFGLAKQSERYEMTEQCKIPVRYLSPETLEHFIFTPKTDVFSFGCVIWEIYENGQQPHDGKNGTTIRQQVRKREFLKLATSAPEELRKLVSEKIFVSDPENRCTMSMIVQTVEKLEKTGGK